MRARSYAAGRAERTASTSALGRGAAEGQAQRAARGVLAQPHRPHDVRRLRAPRPGTRSRSRPRCPRHRAEEAASRPARPGRSRGSDRGGDRPSVRRRACRGSGRADPPRGGRAARRRAPPLRSAPPRRVLQRRRTRPRRGHPGCPRAGRAAVRRRAGEAPPAPPAPRRERPRRPARRACARRR